MSDCCSKVPQNLPVPLSLRDYFDRYFRIFLTDFIHQSLPFRISRHLAACHCVAAPLLPLRMPSCTVLPLSHGRCQISLIRKIFFLIIRYMRYQTIIHFQWTAFALCSMPRSHSITYTLFKLHPQLSQANLAVTPFSATIRSVPPGHMQHFFHIHYPLR